MRKSKTMALEKNQHYVSQFYLRGFGASETSIFVFDKEIKKSFRSSIEHVASEEFFYELPLLEGRDTKTVEKIWGKLETQFAAVIKDLINEVEHCGKFTPGKSERNRGLAALLVMQSLRTREYREFQDDLVRRVGEFYNEMQTLRLGQLPEADLIPVPERATFSATTPLQHAKVMFNLPYIESVMTILFEHIWIIGENNTSQPLYTSDNPVVRHSHAKPYRGSGFASPGIEIIFPLSSRHILVLLDRPHFKQSDYLTDRIVHKLLPEQVLHYNVSQVRDSYRQVFCQQDLFDQAREYIEVFPDVCEPARPRIGIGIEE
jgi:Protein of unknown function (DUF4238)